MWRHNASWGHPSLLGRNVLAFIQEPLKNGRVSWTTVILHYTLPVQFATSYQDSSLIWTIKPTRLGAIACGTGAKREWGGRRKSRERKGKGSLPSLPNPPIPLPLSTPAMVKPDQQLGSLFGSLSNDDGDRNEDGKKAIGFRLEKQQLCTCITLFCTFLCCRCTTTKWKCLILRFVEDVNTWELLSFSFPGRWYCILEFHYKKKMPTFEDLNEME